MTRICPSCMASNNDDTKFSCFNCGAKMPNNPFFRAQAGEPSASKVTLPINITALLSTLNNADRAELVTLIAEEHYRLCRESNGPIPSREKAPAKQTQVGGDTQPIDLIRCMTPSGNMLVDYAKANAIKYAFRIKGGKEKVIEDLQKAIHYCQIAIEELQK